MKFNDLKEAKSIARDVVNNYCSKLTLENIARGLVGNHFNDEEEKRAYSKLYRALAKECYKRDNYSDISVDSQDGEIVNIKNIPENERESVVNSEIDKTPDEYLEITWALDFSTAPEINRAALILGYTSKKNNIPLEDLIPAFVNVSPPYNIIFPVSGFEGLSRVSYTAGAIFVSASIEYKIPINTLMASFFELYNRIFFDEEEDSGNYTTVDYVHSEIALLAVELNKKYNSCRRKLK